MHAANEQQERSKQIEEQAIRRREKLANLAIQAQQRVSGLADERRTTLSPAESNAERRDEIADIDRHIDRNQRVIQKARREISDAERLAEKARKDDAAIGFTLEAAASLDMKLAEKIDKQKERAGLAQERIAAAHKKDIELIERKKKLEGELAASNQRKINVSREQLEIQKQIVREAGREAEEKDRAARNVLLGQESLAVRVGRLSGRDRLQATELLKKAASGEAFTIRDIKTERRLGLGLEEAREAERRFAKEAGLFDLAGRVSAGRDQGTFSGEAERLRAESDAAERRAAEATRPGAKPSEESLRGRFAKELGVDRKIADELFDAAREFTRKQREGDEQLNQTIKGLVDSQKKSNEAIAELNREVQDFGNAIGQ